MQLYHDKQGVIQREYDKDFLCSSDGILSLIRLRIPVAHDSFFDSLFICVP